MPDGSSVASCEAGTRRRFAVALPRLACDERRLLAAWAPHGRRIVEALRSKRRAGKPWPSECDLRETLEKLERSVGDFCDTMAAEHMKPSGPVLRDLLLFHGTLESLDRLVPHLLGHVAADGMDAVLRAYLEEPLAAIEAGGPIRILEPISPESVDIAIALSKSAKKA